MESMQVGRFAMDAVRAGYLPERDCCKSGAACG